jgi:hypothetical protein
MKQRLLTILWIFIATLSRLIPHPANVTPFTNLCLLAGSQINKATAFVSMMIALILSDLLLAHIYGYSAFGAWSWFTYSGFAIVILIGTLLRNKLNKKTLLLSVASSSIIYWLWTNFGTWLITSMYAKTWTGLIACYIAALPFLRNSLLGDLGWMLVIWGIYYFLCQPKTNRAKQHDNKQVRGRFFVENISSKHMTNFKSSKDTRYRLSISYLTKITSIIIFSW